MVGPPLAGTPAFRITIQEACLIPSHLQIAQAPGAAPSARLHQLTRDRRHRPLAVVSNGEPHGHEHGDGGIVVQRRPGGVVTAPEPPLRARGGTFLTPEELQLGGLAALRATAPPPRLTDEISAIRTAHA